MIENFSRQRYFLKELYQTAVRAALPEACLPSHLPEPPKGRLVIIAIGKAAASMAAAAETHYARHWPAASLSGLALTRYGHGVPTRKIEVIEAAHPVPDKEGMEASKRILALARDLTEDDLALVLLSGGGSALTALPIEGISLDDKRSLTRALLESGAPIGEINCVRKHLSLIKAGRLAEAIAPAASLTLAISDVAGDDPAVIASGPTLPDPTTRQDAEAVLDRHDIAVATHIRDALRNAPETPKPGDAAFARAEFKLIASGALSLAAAEALARQNGYAVHNLGDGIEGEARDIAFAHSSLALRTKAPAIILSGGEVAVTFNSKPGRGGPNQEYALSLAHTLAGAPGISALAADTDGIDGGSGSASDPAGAMIFPDTLVRAAAAGLDLQDFLAAHNSGSFFSSLHDLLVTGPSYTNVNDFRVILVES